MIANARPTQDHSQRDRHIGQPLRGAVVLRLERLALAGMPQGVGWYRRARSRIIQASAALGCDSGRFADVLSILSPRLSVSRSVHLSARYMADGELPDDAGVISSVRAALDHWERTGEIRGPKTRAFARALRGDERAIVLDVWMARALGWPHRDFTTVHGYRRGERYVERIAERVLISNADAQASIWCGMLAAQGRQTIPELSS